MRNLRVDVKQISKGIRNNYRESQANHQLEQIARTRAPMTPDAGPTSQRQKEQTNAHALRDKEQTNAKRNQPRKARDIFQARDII